MPSKANADAVVEALQSVFPLRRCTTRLGPFVPTTNRRRSRARRATGCRDVPVRGRSRRQALRGRRRQRGAGHDHLTRAGDRSPCRLGSLRCRPHVGTKRPRRSATGDGVLQRDASPAIDRSAARGRRRRRASRRHRAARSQRRAGRHGRSTGRWRSVYPSPPPDVPTFAPLLPRHVVDEVLCLARAFERIAHRVTVLWCDGRWQWPIDAVPEVVGRTPQSQLDDELAA